MGYFKDIKIDRKIRYIILVMSVLSTLFVGFTVSAAPFSQEKTFLFAEATSQTLLKSGQIDFATSIALPADVNAIRIGLDEALDPPATPQDPRYVIVLDVFKAQASRRVLSLKKIPSSVFLGFKGAPLSVTVDDPIQNAQGFSTLASSLTPPNPYGATAQAVGQPIMFSYQYERAKIQARRYLSAHVYLIDRVKQTYIRTTVDVSEQRRFEIAYRVSHYDPRKKKIKEKFDTERDLDSYEKDELLIELTDILNDFAAKATEAKPYTNTMAMHRLIRSSQNQILAKLQANRFDARPLNDPRFDSVVAIYTGPGTLGSGFYVAPDVVMTNWHVVQDQRFVELKTYDGQQTFGTVLGHDVRLDIALVRVQRRGRPVAFQTGRQLDPGTEVEAIGHPQGHEFSITRGIVSAIRKHPSINLPRNAAGEDVLFVQTDAPINPGNSGGPLFYNNRVVGMNTWGRLNSDGLGFAVHYAELLNFINEHLPGFYVDPAGGS